MTTINDAYINALLADASYVNNLLPNQTGANLAVLLAKRMTQELADFIGLNFTVVTQASGYASSFDAIVWRGNTGTAFAGQVYVSMRGTQGTTDIAADADLATTGLAREQLADMVNWWMRATTSPLTNAAQINKDFALVTSAPGTGTLTSIGAIKSVNGHSLGGYLASAFVRLFGAAWPVGSVNTFNSAGFSRLAASNIEIGFNQISQRIGAGLGLRGFSNAQNNYYAQNGINLTTNTWDPIGFAQYGTRIPLYQENLTPSVINNHYMYKLTDLLALGNALEKLDTSLSLTKLASLVSAGSNRMEGSYEGVLDGLRRLFAGASAATTLIGDANSDGLQPAARQDFHTNLTNLEQSAAFKALIGKVLIQVGGRDLASRARNDFGALAALLNLSPIWITGNGIDDGPLNSLWSSGAWTTQRSVWQADRSMSQQDLDAGKQTYTDNWLDDRASMVSAVVRYNQSDSIGNLAPALTRGPNQITYSDADTGVYLTVRNDGSQPRTFVKFGGGGGEALTGGTVEDRLYDGAGSGVTRSSAAVGRAEASAPIFH